MELDLSYANSRAFLLPEHYFRNEMNLILVGCGGTGSWLAPGLFRIARLIQEKKHVKVSVSLIDPDHVEQKNVYRQNFCDAEVGSNKAETLAMRYGLAWGVEAVSIPLTFEQARLDDEGLRNGYHRSGKMLISCVDNTEARAHIYDCAADCGIPWLDCGNAREYGQVLFGYSYDRRINDKAFQLGGFCTALPYPAIQHPELVEPEVEQNKTKPRMSCAELALLDSQGLGINQRIAAEATDYLIRLLITGDLRKFATYINLAAGSTRSRYITPEEVLAACGS